MSCHVIIDSDFHDPPIFTGRENGIHVIEFIEQFELVANYNRWSGSKKLAALVLCFHEYAWTWFRSLSQRIKSNYDLVLFALKNKYWSETHQWLEKIDLYKRTMKSNESLQDYTDEIAIRASRLCLSNNEMLFVFVAGLTNNLKSYVILQKPNCFENACRHAYNKYSVDKLFYLSNEETCKRNHVSEHFANASISNLIIVDLNEITWFEIQSSDEKVVYDKAQIFETEVYSERFVEVRSVDVICFAHCFSLEISKMMEFELILEDKAVLVESESAEMSCVEVNECLFETRTAGSDNHVYYSYYDMPENSQVNLKDEHYYKSFSISRTFRTMDEQESKTSWFLLSKISITFVLFVIRFVISVFNVDLKMKFHDKDQVICVENVQAVIQELTSLWQTRTMKQLRTTAHLLKPFFHVYLTPLQCYL